MERTDSGSRGYLEATLDDGLGRSLLTITVQRWRNAHDPDLVRLFENATTMPDGTQLASRRKPMKGGAVQEDTDTRSPDGLRVLLTQLNAPASGLPPTRQGPALIAAQLTPLTLALVDAARSAI